MKSKIEFNVFIYDFNDKKFKPYNIFSHTNFVKDLEKGPDAFDIEHHKTLENWVNAELRYYFWSKCEWELILSPWPPDTQYDEKIDVYTQVKANYPIFMKIVKKNFPKLKKKFKMEKFND